MEIRQLNTFVQVARLGSLSKAAARLHIAQPALSRQMRLLEQTLGVMLFDRHGRGMGLTESGEVLLVRAESILRQVEQTRTDLREHGRVVRGQVHLGLPPTVGDVLAAPLIERFHQRFPEVNIRVVSAMSGYLVDFLHRGEVDLAVTYGIERGSNVGMRPLVEERLYLVGPGDAGLSPAMPVTLEAALSHKIVLPSVPHGLRMLIEKEARRNRCAMTVAIEADALHTLKDVVSRGIARTILPLAPVHLEIHAGLLSAAPISRPDLSRRLVLARPLGRPTSNAVRLFAEMLQAVVREMVERKVVDGKILISENAATDETWLSAR